MRVPEKVKSGILPPSTNLSKSKQKQQNPNPNYSIPPSDWEINHPDTQDHSERWTCPLN